MFGISDPGIWLAYLLAFACLLFSIWFGITTWNKEDDEKTNPTKEITKMSTLTLGIIVIIYMFVIAWLGYLGYSRRKMPVIIY